MKAAIRRFYTILAVVVAGVCVSVNAQMIQKQEEQMPTQAKSEAADTASAAEGQDFRIDQPGTITFKIGVTIKGKIEKPQVMIFLPKEKSYYKKISFSHSFKNDLLEPLPFVPYYNE